MELTRYLESITADTDVLAQLVEVAPRAFVPACPGWDVAQLSRHLGASQRWATEIVHSDTVGRVTMGSGEETSDEELGGWLRQGAAKLVAELAASGPDKPVWTMGQPRTSWFWFRRQALEVAVHRWDAEEAAGTAGPIDSDVAAEGVAELLETFVPGLHRHGGTPGSGETFHVHRTDGPGEWLVRFDESGATVTKEHAKGDVALRGSAPDLLLALWRRRPFDSVEVLGDRQVLDRWVQLVPAI